MSNVLLVDDHQVVRDGLKTIIREQGIGGEFGEATTAVEALKLAAEHPWDLAIVDISLVGRSGLEVMRELKELRPRMPVLVLSMHSEEQYARRAYKAGAAGYITKDSSRAELAGAIAKVIAAELRDQRAQRLKTLASGALGRRIAEQQAQIRLQAALDRIVQRERQWRQRWDTCGHAALKLSLLAV